MFGASNTFGQSPTSSPFGSQSAFGQINNTSSNPFAPRTNAAPFGAQTGGSIFGGSSTGVFGATQPSSPLGFGTSSSSAFGASSAPAFGSSSSPFGGSSVSGKQPAFGGFGSSPNQPSPFGSTSQQSQPAFGNSQFSSSTPFGASSQTSFAASNTPAFGSTNTQAFGSGTSSVFGNTGAPGFGSGGAFGVSSTPTFGSSNASAFGATSNPTFGTQTVSAFGPSSVPSFSVGSTLPFGQSTSVFGTNQTAATSPFGAPNSQFGTQGQSAIGAQRGGSRKAAYTPTKDTDSANGLLSSISAMPVFSDKSHEEVRWEDFQLGDKGGQNPSVQATTGIGIGAPNSQSNPFMTSATIGASSSNSFLMSTPSNPFATKPSPFASTTPVPSSVPAFGSTPIGASSMSAPAFSSSSFSALSTSGANSSAMPSMFGSTASFAGGSSPSIFGSSVAPSFASSPSLFGSAAAQGTTPSFSSFVNTQSSSLFQSTAPSLGQTTSSFGNTTAPTGQPSLFNTSSAGGNVFSSASSLFPASNSPALTQTMPSFSTPLQSGQPAQPTGAFSFGNFGQTQSAGTSSFACMSNNFGQSSSGQLSSTQSAATLQPAPVMNPFGTLPAVPQLIIGQSGTSPSVQYGISSMPVVDEAAPVRISSFLTTRNVSQRRITVGARKYLSKPDIHKLPFFSDDDETHSIPRADALFIPRENPRALVIRPIDQWPLRAHSEKVSSVKETSVLLHENAGNGQESTQIPETTPMKSNQKTNGFHDDHSLQNGSSHARWTGNKSGEATRSSKLRADVEVLMPKLSSNEYYTQPRIEELAAKERAEPGFCCHVKDFVIGHHGYGSIKFFGGTDVRGLDLGSLVQFNNREVIVYMDEGNKPPVGQGLNKPAEVTLLNIKCFDKKTRLQYTEGPKMGRYIDMLKKKAEDQGAEFVSYDPSKGEWKFRVSHFSIYKLEEEDY